MFRTYRRPRAFKPGQLRLDDRRLYAHVVSLLGSIKDNFYTSGAHMSAFRTLLRRNKEDEGQTIERPIPMSARTYERAILGERTVPPGKCYAPPASPFRAGRPTVEKSAVRMAPQVLTF